MEALLTTRRSTASLLLGTGGSCTCPVARNRRAADHWSCVVNANSGDEITRDPHARGYPQHDRVARRPMGISRQPESTTAWRSSTPRTERIARWIGPFGDSIRPFTVKRDGSVVFVTVNFLSGFEVGDLRTGRRLSRVPVQGFPLAPEDYLPSCRSHSRTGSPSRPDEKELWVVDSFLQAPPRVRRHGSA